MTINNMAYLFILTLLTIVIMWFANIPVFSECYMPQSVRLAVGVSLLPPMTLENCLLVTGAFLFLLLTIIPIAVTLVFQGFFHIFNYDKRLTQYILWAIWLGCVYYATQFHFITSDPGAPGYVWDINNLGNI